MSFINQLRAAVQKHAAYRKTLHELRGLNDMQAEDLGLFPGTLRERARKAVYG